MNILVTIVLAVIFRESTGKYSPRVIGGQVAPDGKFPYVASLGNGSHTCTGSILNARWILTAAHCIYNIQANELIVMVGSNSLEKGGQYRRVNYTVVHENFQARLLNNDVGLVRVNKDIVFGENVKPITLATTDFAKPDDTVIFAGWGYTMVNASAVIDLQEINLKITTLFICQLTHTYVTRRQICTWTQFGQGTCKGDSGGPLVAKNGTQVGIASFGKPCAIGFPDVFVRVCKYVDWINRSMKENE